MAATAVENGAPVGELGAALPQILPGWDRYSRELFGANVAFNDLEHVRELHWPYSVRVTFPRMATDSQLKALERGTILQVTRLAWGIDPNGAPPEMVTRACADWNLPLLEDAITAAKTGESKPVPRARNRFSWHRHLEHSALKALRYGHYYCEIVGDIGDDMFWHPVKLGPLPPRWMNVIRPHRNGELSYVQQIGLDAPLIDATRVQPYVWDPEEDPGDWLGTSMYRSCYREWLIKDRLLRVDAQNHENAGGKTNAIAPPNATPGEREAIAAAAQQAGKTLGSTGAFPAGTTLEYFRAGGTDVVASINRHDEAMSRPWMLMVINLGSTQTGSRALGKTFDDILGRFQEGIAQWAVDSFNECTLERWADWNYGPDTEYVPKLAYFRPEDYQPAAQMTESDTALVANDEMIQSALADARERRGVRARKPARAAAIPLPDRKLRRQPTAVEVRAAVDFKQIDQNWQSQVDQLVNAWQSIRADQIVELEQLITGTGDLAALAQVRATAAGADLIAARLKAMAQLGASEAAAEAQRQGVAAAMPELGGLETELEARAAALEQLLASSLSQAAANKAVQLSGGGLTPSEVAAATSDYLAGLSDTYLADQFSGALSAAQNAGRLAVMDHNQATRYYASELLDTNTCEPCAEVDGTEYETGEAAAVDYPAGGYRDCQGGPRCRGTIVAVYDEEPATS